MEYAPGEEEPCNSSIDDHENTSYLYEGPAGSSYEGGPYESFPTRSSGRTDQYYRGHAISAQLGSESAGFNSNPTEWTQGGMMLYNSNHVSVDTLAYISNINAPTTTVSGQNTSSIEWPVDLSDARESLMSTGVYSHPLPGLSSSPTIQSLGHISDLSSMARQDDGSWGSLNPFLEDGNITPSYIVSDPPHSQLSERLVPGNLSNDLHMSLRDTDSIHEFPTVPTTIDGLRVAHLGTQLSSSPRTSWHQLNSSSRNAFLTTHSSLPGATSAFILPSLPYNDDPSQSINSDMGEPLSTMDAKLLDDDSSAESESSITEMPKSYPATSPVRFVSCKDCGVTFRGQYGKANLARHQKSKHGGEFGLGVEYPCEATDCRKVFKRKDARLKHYRKLHPILCNTPVYPRKISKKRLDEDAVEIPTSHQATWHEQTPSLPQWPSHTSSSTTKNLPQKSQKVFSGSKTRDDSDANKRQHMRKLQLSPTEDRQNKRQSRLSHHRTLIACGHCKSSKTKCLVVPDDAQGRCANCIRLKKECNFYLIETDSHADASVSNLTKNQPQSFPAAPLDPSKERIVQNAVEKFMLWFTQRNTRSLSRLRTSHAGFTYKPTGTGSSRLDEAGGGKERGTSSQEYAPQQSNSAESNAAYYRAKREGKRKVGDDEREHQSDSDRDRPPGKKARRHISSNDSLPKCLACPFFKHNPLLNKRGACSGPGWDTVHRIKSHIARAHKMTPRCPRCLEDFTDQSELIKHLAKTPQCSCKEPEQRSGQDDCMKIPFEKWDEIQRFKPRKLLEPVKWKRLYLILFPDADEANVPSPYYEYGTTESDNTQRNFLGLYNQRIPIFIENEIRRVVSLEILDEAISERLNGQITAIFQRAQRNFLRECALTTAHHAGGGFLDGSRNTEQTMIDAPTTSQYPGIIIQPAEVPEVPEAPEQGSLGNVAEPKPSFSEAGHDSGYHSNESPDLPNNATPHFEIGSPSATLFPEIAQRQRLDNAAIQHLLESTESDGVTGFEMGDIDIDPEITELMKMDLIDVPVDADWFSPEQWSS